MTGLKVRKDWLLLHAKHYPAWQPIITQLIALNAFLVIPAKYGIKDGDAKDCDLLVQLFGHGNIPGAFRLDHGLVYCVNYPDTFKPMSPEKFVSFIKKQMETNFRPEFLKWWEGRLNQDS